MHLLAHALALGVWPALPITGRILFPGRDTGGTGAIGKPRLPVPSLALLTAAGMLPWSVVMLISAAIGAFRPELIGLAGWIITVVSVGRLVQQRQMPTWRGWDACDSVLLMGLLIAGELYLLFPGEYLLGGRDMGVYTNHAIYLAHHGRLDVPYPWGAGKEETLFAAMLQIPGFYKTKNTMTVQFGHLYPIWLAQAYASCGRQGLFRLNGGFALLGVLVFGSLARKFVSRPHATVATLFLALNPAQIWLARTTLSEMLTQLFIWAGLWCVVEAGDTENSRPGALAGLFLGFAALVRIDCFLLVPFVFLADIFISRITRRSRGEGGSHALTSLYGAALPVWSLSLIYYVTFSRPYLIALARNLIAIAMLTGVVLAGGVTWAIAPVRLQDRVRNWVTSQTALSMAGIMLFLLVGLAYSVRPKLEPFALFSWPGHHLDGTRDYREESVVNLTQYLSVLVVAAAVCGWYCRWRAMVGGGSSRAELRVLCIVGGVAAMYLWNPSIAPDHFWASRRFLPVIIPGCILYSAIGACLLLRILPTLVARSVSTVMVAYLLTFLVQANMPFFDVAEFDGVSSQMEALAEKVPDGEIVFAQGSMSWITPLFATFDKKVVPLDLSTTPGKTALRHWVTRCAAQGKPVHLLCDDLQHLVLDGVTYNEVSQALLDTQHVQPTVHPLPTELVRERITIHILRVMAPEERP
jgi:hypothetical protein